MNSTTKNDRGRRRARTWQLVRSLGTLNNTNDPQADQHDRHCRDATKYDRDDERPRPPGLPLSSAGSTGPRAARRPIDHDHTHDLAVAPRAGGV